MVCAIVMSIKVGFIVNVAEQRISLRPPGAGVPSSAPIILSIGGKPATVTGLGPAPGQPDGVAQISATIAGDASTGNAVPVVLLMNSISAQSGVTIAAR